MGLEHCQSFINIRRSIQPMNHIQTEKSVLRLPGTYAAKIDKIRPPLHVSLNNSVTTVWKKKIFRHLIEDYSIYSHSKIKISSEY